MVVISSMINLLKVE